MKKFLLSIAALAMSLTVSAQVDVQHQKAGVVEQCPYFAPQIGLLAVFFLYSYQISFSFIYNNSSFRKSRAPFILASLNANDLKRCSAPLTIIHFALSLKISLYL